jgi:hypothetical protein
VTERWFQIRATLREAQVLRLIWIRDTLGEVLTAQEVPKAMTQRKPSLISGYAAAAMIFLGLISLPVLRWQWLNAQAAIAANARALPEPELAPEAIDDSLAGVMDQGEDGEGFGGQLAEADSTRVAEGPRSGPDGTLMPKQTPHSRVGSDPEHGGSVPVDAREPKPIY